jgi:hypothetical protein
MSTGLYSQKRRAEKRANPDIVAAMGTSVKASAEIIDWIRLPGTPLGGRIDL